MKLIATIIFCAVLILKTIPIKANSIQDEYTIRNQFLSDIFLLKEGVENLQVSVETLKTKSDKQLDILKDLKLKQIYNEHDSEAEKGYCEKITGMFNATLNKQVVLESRLIAKFEEKLDEQLQRFEDIIISHKLNKNCGSQGVSSNTLALFSTTLSEMSEKIDKLEEKFVKLEIFDEKLNAQQTKFDKLVEIQFKTLQDINDKFSKNNEQFEKIHKELADVKELSAEIKKVLPRPRPKLPMEVILGLTSSNITK